MGIIACGMSPFLRLALLSAAVFAVAHCFQSDGSLSMDEPTFLDDSLVFLQTAVHEANDPSYVEVPVTKVPISTSTIKTIDASKAACQNACDAEPRCKGFKFVKASSKCSLLAHGDAKPSAPVVNPPAAKTPAPNPPAATTPAIDAKAKAANDAKAKAQKKMLEKKEHEADKEKAEAAAAVKDAAEKAKDAIAEKAKAKKAEEDAEKEAQKKVEQAKDDAKGKAKEAAEAVVDKAKAKGEQAKEKMDAKMEVL